ncbi:Protein Aatf, partial [Pseudolycoriella hygida]
MSKKKAKMSSIGEKISELLAPKKLLDPEYNSDDETIAKTRYSGKISSRKEMGLYSDLVIDEEDKQMASHPKLDEELQKTSANVENLLTKICTLQKGIVNGFPETREINRKRHRSEDSEETDRVDKIAKKLESNYDDFRDYRNATISKWYDRTKVLNPGSSKGSKQPTFDIMRTIEGALSNKDDLVKRSQTQKGGYEIIGMEKLNDNSEPTTSTEIYDDTDFYHAQLRELIEFKTSASTNPAEATKAFIELQKLRNQVKKVVDTRASKGRKVRYADHKKLANFGPRNDPCETSREARSELFSSVFASRMG